MDDVRLKRRAARIKKILADTNTPMKLGHIYELMARMDGYRTHVAREMNVQPNPEYQQPRSLIDRTQQLGLTEQHCSNFLLAYQGIAS